MGKKPAVRAGRESSGKTEFRLQDYSPLRIESTIMSEILGVSFPLSAIAIMIVFMVLMMGIGRMRMGCMGGYCRCMEMIHPGAGEKRS